MEKNENPKGDGVWAFLDIDWIPDKYYWGKDNHTHKKSERRN